MLSIAQINARIWRTWDRIIGPRTAERVSAVRARSEADILQ